MHIYLYIHDKTNVYQYKNIININYYKIIMWIHINLLSFKFLFDEPMRLLLSTRVADEEEKRIRKKRYTAFTLMFPIDSFIYASNKFITEHQIDFNEKRRIIFRQKIYQTNLEFV